MNIIQALILGLVQGLTEFIPVSSSGHLVVFHKILGINNVGLAFDVALHVGTLFALVVFFHKDLAELAKAIFKKTEKSKLAWMLALATIPAVIVGVLLESAAESTFRSVSLVSVNLLAVGLLMLGAEKYYKARKQKTKLSGLKVNQAVGMGLAQAMAIVPGVSRSGATITAGLFGGMDRVAATRFSFLLGIPIIFGAAAKVLVKSSSISEIKSEKDIFIVGVITAFISGLWAIGFLLRYLAKHSLNVFAYYRIALAVFILLSVAIF